MRLGATLVLMAFAWLWLVSAQIPDAGTEWPGPRGFPVLLGIVLAMLGVLSSLGGLRPVTPEGRETRPTDDESRHEHAVAGATFALLVSYAFLLERVGFLIATPLVVVVAMAGVLRMRRWVLIGCFAVAFPLGCWVVFSALLGIPLPRGVWVAW